MRSRWLPILFGFSRDGPISSSARPPAGKYYRYGLIRSAGNVMYIQYSVEHLPVLFPSFSEGTFSGFSVKSRLKTQGGEISYVLTVSCMKGKFVPRTVNWCCWWSSSVLCIKSNTSMPLRQIELRSTDGFDELLC